MTLHKFFRNIIFILLTAFAISLVLPDISEARRGFSGGGFKGRSSSRASSWGSKALKSSGSWSSKPLRTSSRSTSMTGMNRGNAADKALFEKAKSQGTVYQTRSEAQKAFSQKYKDQYPTRFPSQPNQRPEYIPKSTTVEGKKFDVDWNPQYGGYGYNGPGGWTPYSALGDLAMLSLLMSNRSYYYGQQPGSSLGGMGSNFMTGVVVVVGMIVLAKIFGRM